MGEQADALLERLVGSLIGTAELMNVYLGERLDLYAPLAEGWLTSSDLAARAGIAGRYAREWLEEQAVAGFRCPLANRHACCPELLTRPFAPLRGAKRVQQVDAPTQRSPRTG